MKPLCHALFALLLLPAVTMAADPWGNADAKAGKEHHEKSASPAMSASMAATAARCSTRDGRLLMTSSSMSCSVPPPATSQIQAGWFPDEGRSRRLPQTSKLPVQKDWYVKQRPA